MIFHTYTHTYIHTYLHTYVRTYVERDRERERDRYRYRYIYIYTYTYTHTYIHQVCECVWNLQVQTATVDPFDSADSVPLDEKLLHMQRSTPWASCKGITAVGLVEK